MFCACEIVYHSTAHGSQVFELELCLHPYKLPASPHLFPLKVLLTVKSLTLTFIISSSAELKPRTSRAHPHFCHAQHRPRPGKGCEREQAKPGETNRVQNRSGARSTLKMGRSNLLQHGDKHVTVSPHVSSLLEKFIIVATSTCSGSVRVRNTTQCQQISVVWCVT